MRHFIVFGMLFISGFSHADAYLVCPWEGYTDYIHLYKENKKSDHDYYSEGVFYRNIFQDDQQLSFEFKDTCHFNCAFPGHYTILSAYQLNRKDLTFTDRTKVIVGGGIISTQCKSVPREIWTKEKVMISGDENKI